MVEQVLPSAMPRHGRTWALSLIVFLVVGAFVVALAWAGSLYSRIERGNSLGGYGMLGWFLVACVLFGWGNVGYESWRLNNSQTGSIITLPKG